MSQIHIIPIVICPQGSTVAQLLFHLWDNYHHLHSLCHWLGHCHKSQATPTLPLTKYSSELSTDLKVHMPKYFVTCTSKMTDIPLSELFNCIFCKGL